MPALNFQMKFVPMIVSGEKKQTIRKERKNRIKPGDKLYLNTGMRTRACTRILTTICTAVDYIYFTDVRGMDIAVVGNRQLSWGEMEVLAKADGFKDVTEFFRFFNRQYGPDFEGVIVRWA